MTSLLFQPFAFATGEFVWMIVGFVLSMRIVIVACGSSFPARWTLQYESVWTPSLELAALAPVCAGGVRRACRRAAECRGGLVDVHVAVGDGGVVPRKVGDRARDRLMRALGDRMGSAARSDTGECVGAAEAHGDIAVVPVVGVR